MVNVKLELLAPTCIASGDGNPLSLMAGIRHDQAMPKPGWDGALERDQKRKTKQHARPCHPQECLSLPSDVASTVLKLVVQYDGWEYVVYERALRTEASASEDEDTPLLVTVGRWLLYCGLR